MAQPTDRFHIVLNLSAIDASPPLRGTLVTGLVEVGAKCAFAIAHPAIGTAVTAAGASYATYVAKKTVADASAHQAAVDAAAELKARNANNKDIDDVRTLTENRATSNDDIIAMTLEPWLGPPAPPAADVAPSVDIKLGKKGTGKATATVHETGKTRHNYTAEGSPVPFGPSPGANLPGTGKQRKLTGIPGSQTWVRFALIHKGVQSAWSTPLLITFP